MAKNEVCTECGQSLVNGNCVNRQCSLVVTEEAYGSLVPDEIVSLDPTQIVDFTGTLGVVPVDGSAIFATESVDQDADADSAQTRMVDDDFYKQIREFFPADDSGSKSSSDMDESRESHPDASRSLSMQGVRNDYSIEEFVPPVRDIRFPSDTASLEELRAMDPASMEGDEYQIVEKLGEGGYGVVFEAEQVALNRPVAVKVLKPKRKKPGSRSQSRTGTGTGELQRRRDQFLHEAKITARLQHPNIVPLYDFGINTQGQLFYSMKKVERRPWSSVIQNAAKLLDVSDDEVNGKSDRLVINKNVEIFDKVCDAMAYSHAQKVIHRDLKPDNIMIGDYGEVLLIDFGMALDFSHGQPEFSAGGTLVYMAPEMAEHFAKQKEIQLAAQKTAQKLGVDRGSVFLDQSNLLGIGKLAKQLIQESKDQGVIELAETLIRLDAEERGLAAKISYASDIYLLGAILYQVAVGHPPHYFPIGACKQGRKEKFQKELWLALRNGFQQYSEVTDPLRISLRNIAVKAMRTDPRNRYQTVEELQRAIEGFQLEVQSLEMTETGKEELDKSKGGTGYQHLLPALESFRGAGTLFPESSEAKSLQVETACVYANRAHSQKDFDAGLSILDEYVFAAEQQSEPVVAARNKLIDGKKKRARNRKLAWASSIAAIVIPVATFFIFTWQTAETLNDLKMAKNDLVESRKDAGDAKIEAEEAKTKAAAEIAAAETAAAAQIAQGKVEAEKEIVTAKAAADTEVAKAKETSDLEIQQAKVAAQAGIEMAKSQAEADVRIAKEAAAKDIEAAKEQSRLAKLEADKYSFDAEFGLYNSNVLTIPLDLRTGKLGEVAKKLDRLEDAKPHFKNGWEVKHFLKRANVAGVNENLGGNTSVIDIVPVPDSTDSIVVGLSEGKSTVWRMTSAGETTKLDLAMPADGQVADVSISGDGQWLALAIDNVTVVENKFSEHLWVINLGDGTRAKLAENEGVVGCRVVEFAESKTDLQLVTVEELSGYRGLNQRVQVVTRTLEAGALSQGNATHVAATTRDLGRVRYLASARWDAGQPSVGLAYQSLNQAGDDVFRLETLISDGATGLQSSKLEVANYPTAILAGPAQRFYCGYADGSVDQFEAGNLTSKPTRSNNLNENEIVRLESTDDGRLISGSENGVLIVRNPDHSLFKTLQGQTGLLSALTIGQADPVNGFTMVSGDKDGNVRVWEPETSLHDATIRKDSVVNVTCGAVDVGLAETPVPATAFGTSNGQVYYFSTDEMLNRKGGTRVGGANDSRNATFRFKSPFESFGTAFNDFDSMGIIGDHFVLMKDDGTFFRNYIDDRNSGASARSGSEDLSEGKNVFGNFIPLLASVHDKDYFFSTNPMADDQLLYWKKSGSSFSHETIKLAESSRGGIKRLQMSHDGNWLAVVRQQGRNQLAGKYIAEMYDVSAGSSSIKLSGSTQVFQVGDPAFVGFSPDSQRMILHFHKRAPDRETWVEHWELVGQQWKQSGEKQKVADRKVDLVDWDLSSAVEKMITKANKNYFLVSADAQSESYNREDFQVNTQVSRERLKTVRPTGNSNTYYVLSSNSLNLYTGTTKGKSAQFKAPIEDARDLRVFGNRAVLLDKNGFHLIDSELNYVTKLAAREDSVKALSLSTGRLAILYSNNLCRIWDVRGEVPEGIGMIENAQSVKLSPDGQWAVCQLDDSLQIFPIGSKFDQPKMSIPAADAAFNWTSDDVSKLMLAENVAGKVNWSIVDPATGASVAPAKKLPADLDGVQDFELAHRTGNYMAIKSNLGLSLWAITSGEPVRLNKEEHQFDDGKIKNVESFSFSELKFDDPKQIGTRLVVLGTDGTPGSQAEPRIYLLAGEDPADGQAEASDQPTRYRVVEIEGAFEKKEGLDLIDTQFSGDGKSLLQVDEKGISTLLAN